MRIANIFSLNQIYRRWLPPLAWVYFTCLFGWLAAYGFTGDQHPYIALANTLAVNFFLPMPAIFLANTILRRKEIWWGLAISILAFIWLWGGLFLPRLPLPPSDSETLTVMSYNVLGSNTDTQAVLEVIQESDPDVVALQELNPHIAAALNTHLIERYPYQIMDTRDGVGGHGVISKYPLTESGLSLTQAWTGIPQVLTLDWHGTEIFIVNFHMWAPAIYPPQQIAINFHMRELQSQSLLDFADSVKAPIILAGDANTTSLNTAYTMLTQTFTDAWVQAGFGFGHTFPGADSPGSSRPNLAGWLVPQWLVRIDYIFLSPHFNVLSAHLSTSHGNSDHRAVLAEVSLVRE